jgi:hypothetical protein
METTTQNDLLVLKPYEIQKAELIQLAADYNNHVVTEETFEDSKKVRQKIREKRFEIQNILKDNKGILNAIKDKQEGMAEELIALIRPTEDKIDAGIKSIENKKAEEKARKEREAKQKIENRKSQLYSAGMTWNGKAFILGSKSVSEMMVNDLNDDEFAILFNEVESEAKLIQSQREEEEKRLAAIKEENERLAALTAKKEADFKAEQDRIKKENEVKEAELKAEREKIENEKLELRKKRSEARVSQLLSIGLVYDSANGVYSLLDVEVTWLDVVNLSEETWEEVYDRTVPLVEQAKAEIENIRQEEIAKKKAEEEAIEKARIEREKALRPDREKLLDFAESLNHLQYPTLSTGEALKIITEATGMIRKAQEYILKEVEKF